MKKIKISVNKARSQKLRKHLLQTSLQKKRKVL